MKKYKQQATILGMAIVLSMGISNPTYADWFQNNGVWYYNDEANQIVTDFQYINNKWYFFSTREDESKGALLMGIQWIGHKCYFLNPDDGGAVATNMDYGEYHFGSDGCAVNSINNPLLMGEEGYYSRIGIGSKLMDKDEYNFKEKEGAMNIDDATNPYSKNQPKGYREEEALEFLDILNEARAEKGRTELEIDEELMEAARIRAKELVENYDHVRPDGSSWKTVLYDLDIDTEGIIYGENGNYYHYDSSTADISGNRGPLSLSGGAGL